MRKIDVVIIAFLIASMILNIVQICISREYFNCMIKCIQPVCGDHCETESTKPVLEKI